MTSEASGSGSDADHDHGTEFWADEAARTVVEADRPRVVKGGVSPSGVPHIGNFNEVLRGGYVALALERMGEDPRQVFTRDDRDPLRRVPEKLATLDGEIVELGSEERDELEEHVGKPYVDVPDPFGCCDSWADHFGNILEESADALDVDVDFVSNDALYESGDFLPPTRTFLSDLETSREVIARHQRTVDDGYVPFMPICSECGRITPTPLSVDAENETVEYVCDDAELAGKYEVEGCGHEGTATFKQGKLPWRFEWPSQWQVLDVGFEPFGKDHAEGSWESGTDIARELLGHEPPEPLVYEFFLVDGEKMSASAGNVYTVSEILDMVEPEVLKYFFALDPSKQRDFEVEEIQHLVNEFDRIEAVRYGDEEAADEREELFAERVYPDIVASVDDEKPVRVPYTFAAMVGVAEDDEARLDALRRSGHLPENPTEKQKRDALRRVELARNWARRLGNQYYVDVLEQPPDTEFDEATRDAFDDLADFVDEGHTAEEIQNRIFETAREHDIGVGEFFSSGYELFLGQESGPKLGPLLAALDREFVVERLRDA